MRTLFMLLVVYVASYAWLSTQGSYQVVTSAASTVDLPAGRAWQPKGCAFSNLPAGRAWQPKGCAFSMGTTAGGDHHAVVANTLGLVFMPAIVIDRAFVHKSRPLA